MASPSSSSICPYFREVLEQVEISKISLGDLRGLGYQMDSIDIPSALTLPEYFNAARADELTGSERRTYHVLCALAAERKARAESAPAPQTVMVPWTVLSPEDDNGDFPPSQLGT